MFLIVILSFKFNSTKDKWAHVSCALWIIEVIFGDAEKMEPIMKIASIPVSSAADLVLYMQMILTLPYYTLIQLG